MTGEIRQDTNTTEGGRTASEDRFPQATRQPDGSNGGRPWLRERAPRLTTMCAFADNAWPLSFRRRSHGVRNIDVCEGR
jgi:hypothetical protein